MAQRYLADRGKRKLMITIYLIAFFQMSTVCVTPAIAGMAGAFPDTSQFVIQMCTASCSLMLVLMSAFSGKISAVLSRRTMIAGGFALMALAGTCGFLLSFSPLAVMCWSAILGIGMGLFVAATSSLLIDYYEPDEQSKIAGTQNCIVNIGGMFLSVVGGLLVSIRWNASYLCFLLCLIVAVTAWRNVPQESPKGNGAEKAKVSYHLPGLVWFYGGNVVVFSIVYGVFCSNISLLMAERGITPTGTWSGICVGVFMCGGAVSGLLFAKLSKLLKSGIFVLGYFMVAMGYAVVAAAPGLLVILLGAFICGASLSMIIPQSLISVSEIVTPEQSVAAAGLVMGIGPQIGGVLSPICFTRVSVAIGHSDVGFRYQYACVVAAVLGVILAIVLKAIVNRKVKS